MKNALPSTESGSAPFSENAFARRLKNNEFLLTLLFLLLIGTQISNSQCLTVPPQPSCPVAGAIALTNGMTTTAGNTYCLTGNQNYTNLTMNGGTLVICGNLNLTNFTFNSGTIIVAQGASWNVSMPTAVVFGSNSSVYNYGTVNFGNSIVTGSNNVFMNCLLTSVFNVNFNQMVIQGPNTSFINNGTFTSSYFIVQSNNSPNVVCLGAGSAISTGIMINQYANAFNVPTGTACVQITNTIINSQPMTASPNVQICYIASSVSVAQGPNFGAATVNPNCPSCSIALPVTISNVQAHCLNTKLRVDWTAESEEDCASYLVQRSDDGLSYTDELLVECQSAGAIQTDYSVELPTGYKENAEFVRLKRTTSAGDETFTNPIAVDCSAGFTIDIFPTLVADGIVTISADQPIESIAMYSMEGKKVKTFAIADEKKTTIDVGDIALGQYLLTVQTEHVRVDKLLRIMK